MSTIQVKLSHTFFPKLFYTILKIQPVLLIKLVNQLNISLIIHIIKIVPKCPKALICPKFSSLQISFQLYNLMVSKVSYNHKEHNK